MNENKMTLDRPVKVIRTSPMYKEKKDNEVDLLKDPLLPQIADMWSFLKTYLKKTADIFRIFPETDTILEQRIADIKDSFKLKSAGRKVDAEMVGANNILVNYLVSESLLDDKLSEEEKDELLFTLQKVRAIISKVHGTTPAVIAVDKTNRYAVDLMFMLAESVTKAMSDMSDKSWMECNIVLAAILNVYHNNLNHLLENFHIFINGGELGGATQPPFHAHAMSQPIVDEVKKLPEENKNDKTVLTKEYIKRLMPKTLDGKYISKVFEEVVIENFLCLTESLIPKCYMKVTIDESIINDVEKSHNEVIVKNTEEEKRIYEFFKRIEEIRNYINTQDYTFNEFLKKMDLKSANNIPSLLSKYSSYLTDNSNKDKASQFSEIMKDLEKKYDFWSQTDKKVAISYVSEIFAAVIMKKMKEEGVDKKITAQINKVVPSNLSVTFELTDTFSFSEEETVIPAFNFSAEPHVWAFYGKSIMKIAETSLNMHWQKIYNETEKYLSTERNARDRLIEELDKLFGISKVLKEMEEEGIYFESTPSSLEYSKSERVETDISKITKNYLRYFIQCFNFARKSPLHLPDLCPRATIISLTKDRKLQKIQITPICVYVPIMDKKSFELHFGPFEMIKKTNDRLELIGGEDDEFVVQKTGGEYRTKDRLIFHRDKQEELRWHPRIYEEPLVEGISEVIKHHVLTEYNLPKNKYYLYICYYMKKYITECIKDDSDSLWKEIAEILYSSPVIEESIFSMKKLDDINKELDKVLLERQYDYDKASKIIKVIKEARDEAINKIKHVDEESRKLNTEIRSGTFMRSYNTLNNTVNDLMSDNNFCTLLNPLNLPENEKTKKHIIYIFCARQEDRSEEEQDILKKDNLDTISFFRIAKLIVDKAFEEQKKVRKQILEMKSKDDNSDYILHELISRIIYKYIRESPKRYWNYRYYLNDELSKINFFDDVFINSLKVYICEELVHKSYQNKDYWEAIGKKDKEGYIELILSCTLTPINIAGCVFCYTTENYKAIERIMNQIRLSGFCRDRF